MMTSTSFAAVACLSLMSMAAPQPLWQADYAQAKEQAVRLNKPVAVFIAHGKNGYDAVLAEGKLAASELATLQANYVCVYVDTDTPQGQTLASSFEMTQGVVLSDRGANKQALRHEGPVAHVQLETYLSTVATSTEPAVTTVIHGRVIAQPMVAQPLGTILGPVFKKNCPNCR
ncbi:MAG: hypothetical protein ACRCZF_03095 [Gemmataceae bacterium]